MEEVLMDNSVEWSKLDAAALSVTRALESQLRQSHGALFAAAFIDEFESVLRAVAFERMVSHRPKPGSPK